MTRYLHIATDGTQEEIEIAGELALESLQQYVDGYVEAVPPRLYRNIKVEAAYANEDGIPRNMPWNHAARIYLKTDLHLRGPVIIQFKE